MARRDLRGGLDGSGAKPRHHERDIGLGGGVREHQIGAGTKERGESGGRDTEGTRVLAVEEINGLIARGDIDEVVGDEAFAIEGGFVASDTEFIFNAALDEIIDDTGQTPLGHFAEVVDIDRAIHIHSRISSPRKSRSRIFRRDELLNCDHRLTQEKAV